MHPHAVFKETVIQIADIGETRCMANTCASMALIIPRFAMNSKKSPDEYTDEYTIEGQW